MSFAIARVGDAPRRRRTAHSFSRAAFSKYVRAICTFFVGDVSRQPHDFPCDRAKGPGIVSSTLAVHTNKNLAQVDGDVEVVIKETCRFCSGSSSSSSALAGSP